MTKPFEATEFERRAGIESLEALHALRRHHTDTLAPLELLFGSGGDRWEAIRSRHRDGIAKLIAAELDQAGRKIPGVDALKAAANADERHIKFCNEQEAKFPEYMRVKNKLQDIQDRIESRLAEMRYQSSEMRMAG